MLQSNNIICFFLSSAAIQPWLRAGWELDGSSRGLLGQRWQGRLPGQCGGPHQETRGLWQGYQCAGQQAPLWYDNVVNLNIIWFWMWSFLLITSICLSLQEEKIAALQSFADQLISADHYAKPEIFNRRNEVLDRSGSFCFILRRLSESVPCEYLWFSCDLI